MSRSSEPTLPGLVEHDTNDGCPDDSGEHWRALHGAVQKELIHIRDMWMRGLKREREFTDGTYAVAHRTAWESLVAFQSWMVLDKARRPLQQLAGLVLSLPDRASGEPLVTLRMAAAEVSDALNSDGAKEQHPVLDEMRRLRTAVRLAGEWLHNQGGTSGGESCRCPGCELCRMVDAPPDPITIHAEDSQARALTASP